MNTCDCCGIEMDTEKLIWPEHDDDLDYNDKHYDYTALCQDCYNKIKIIDNGK